MDEHFLQRVYKTSLIVMALVMLFGTVYMGFLWGLAFLLAATWSIVNLWVLARLLTTLFLPRNGFSLILFFFLKVPILYGLILTYLVFVPWRFDALLSGVLLPYAVIVLKALGSSLVEIMKQNGSLR